MRSGKLFKRTSRRRGSEERSGKEVDVKRGQWDKVNLERFRSGVKEGIVVRFGECDITVFPD